MTESVRAFVAVELSDEVKTALSGLVDELRNARVRSMRTVRPEGIHLTLKFLGSAPRTQIEPLTTELSKATARLNPFTVELGEVGVFPSRARARVLWVGVGGEVAPLLELHDAVEEATARLGFERDRRPYSAHLTVARLGDRASAVDRQGAVGALCAARLQEGLTIVVKSVVLMQSRLSREGARHDRLAHMPLAGAIPRGAP